MSVAEEITRIKNAVTDIKNAIVGKGVAVPSNAKINELSPYINSISGGGGSCDLIDVAEFPTANVQDDKVYRAEVETNAEYDIYVVESGVATSLKSMAESEGLILDFYEMNSTSEVKNPIVTDIEASPVWTFYIEKPTGFAYLYIDGIGWVTLGFLFSEGTITNFDKGYTNNPESETVDGIYVYNEGGIYTGIGVPNANNDKKIYSWNGTKWTEQENISKPVYGRVYKAIERLVFESGTGIKYTWYAKFHENYVEMIYKTYYNAVPTFSYYKITKYGNFYGIGGDEDEEIVATNVGKVTLNGNTLIITYDISKIMGGTTPFTYTNRFIFFSNGIYVKSIPHLPVEVGEENTTDEAFAYAFNLLRGGDFELQADNSEWDNIVAEQGWNIP